MCRLVAFCLLQTQFILVTVHSAQLLFIECDYPILFVYWIGLYAVIFLVMFAHFYIKTYKKPSRPDHKNHIANGVTSKKKKSSWWSHFKQDRHLLYQKFSVYLLCHGLLMPSDPIRLHLSLFPHLPFFLCSDFWSLCWAYVSRCTF